MWRLIELRLRRRLPAFGWILLVSWVAAGTAIWVTPALRSPERLAALAGAVALIGGFLMQAVVSAVDKREGRPVLHASLPIGHRQLVSQEIFEPWFTPILLGGAALAAAALGRWLVGGAWDTTSLLFLAALSAFMLTMGQLQIFVEELQKQVQWRLAVGLAVILALAGGGAIVGYVLGSFALAGEGEVSTSVELFGNPSTLLSFTATAILVAGLNQQLLNRRQSFTA
ncbi:MAG: hypothetical protein AAGM22_02200 [Acidobacteriota bacterium]